MVNTTHSVMHLSQKVENSCRSDGENKRPNFELVLCINILQEDNFLLYFPVVAVLFPAKQ